MKIKKYLTGLMVVAMSVTTLFSAPLYAAGEKPVLKLEEAIKSAVTYSNQMVLNTMAQEKLREQLKARQNDAFLVYHTTYLQKAQNEQQTKIIEDQITSDITSKYNEMVALEKEINNLAKNITITTKQMKQLEIKKEKGLVNPLTYESSQIELEGLKNSKVAKEEELKNAQEYFKIITGKDLEKYILDHTVQFEVFRIQGSVSGYINSKLSEYLKYDKDLAQLNKDNIITADSMPVVYDQYLDKKYASDQQIISLEEKQKNLRQGLMTSYSSLFTIEEKIVVLDAKLALTDKKIQVAALRYKAGLISALDYDKELLSKEQDELTKFNLINQYNQLKETIEKPWLVSAKG